MAACVAALNSIGYEKGAATLREAAHILDPEGASIDRDVRMKQYARLSEATEKQLDKMSEAFYFKSSDRVQLRYMLRHHGLFTRIHKARLAARESPNAER